MMTRRQIQSRPNHSVTKRTSLPKIPIEYNKRNTTGSKASQAKVAPPCPGTKRVSYASTLSRASPSPSTSTTSKITEEMNALKQLNADLIQRVKFLEEELKSTKRMCDELIANSPKSTSSVPEVTEPFTSEISPAVLQLEPDMDNSRNPFLLICGDSMTREFGLIFQKLLPHYSVLSHTLPGASFSAVLNDLPKLAKNFTKKDIVFILAGTNDVPLLSPERIEREILRLIQNFSRIIIMCLERTGIVKSQVEQSVAASL
ncbi:hypothetical protein M8J76_014239 [Diaphorina citri]|nr:hypothetical protein M8J76_014239 [Diaphorina citri]